MLKRLVTAAEPGEGGAEVVLRVGLVGLAGALQSRDRLPRQPLGCGVVLVPEQEEEEVEAELEEEEVEAAAVPEGSSSQPS